MTMKRSRLYLFLVLVAFWVAPKTFPTAAQAGQTAADSPEAREARLAWFKQAKYGMFIHWGLYAIPAGEWKGQQSLGLGEWIMNRSKIPVKEYEQLTRQFNPIKFNADAWVQLAQDA